MFLTVKETAALYRVSTRTIRERVKSGVIEGTRVGRQIRIPLQQFADVLDVEEIKAEIRERAAAAGANR